MLAACRISLLSPTIIVKKSSLMKFFLVAQYSALLREDRVDQSEGQEGRFPLKLVLPPESLIPIAFGQVDLVPSTFQSSRICESCLVLWLVATMQILMAIFPASKNCPLFPWLGENGLQHGLQEEGPDPRVPAPFPAKNDP